jgi:hypothetical protein
VKCPPISGRLEKLLERRGAAQVPKPSKLEKRLDRLQQTKEEEKTA